MASVAFDHVEPQSAFERLPIALRLTTSRSSAVMKLLLLAPAMVGLAIPLTLLAARAAAEPWPFSLLADRPLASLQVLLGLGLWAALFIWPLKRIVGRFGASRSVTIDGAKVAVTDASPFGSRSWSAPLGSYAGIAHHVRASLSGLRHELVLVHSDPAKNVLIAIADRIPQSTVDKAKALLGLPEVPAKDLYVRGQPA